MLLSKVLVLQQPEAHLKGLKSRTQPGFSSINTRLTTDSPVNLKGLLRVWVLCKSELSLPHALFYIPLFTMCDFHGQSSAQSLVRQPYRQVDKELFSVVDNQELFSSVAARQHNYVHGNAHMSISRYIHILNKIGLHYRRNDLSCAAK